MALDGYNDRLARKAWEALHRQNEQQWVKELMEEFKDTNYCRRWNLLMSIIELGDPYLLGNSDDALWIGQIFDDASPEYWDYAEDAIEKREKKVLEEAKREDSKARG